MEFIWLLVYILASVIFIVSLKKYAKEYIRYYNYKDNEKAFYKTFLLASITGVFVIITGGYVTFTVFALYDNVLPLIGAVIGAFIYLYFEFFYNAKPFYFAKVIGMHGENRGNTFINTGLIMIFVGVIETILWISYYLF